MPLCLYGTPYFLFPNLTVLVPNKHTHIHTQFHYDPAVVCNFTALYPTLLIAYNLFYSTCAGKLDYHSTRREMREEGRTNGHVGPFLYSERRSASVLRYHMKSLK